MNVLWKYLYLHGVFHCFFLFECIFVSRNYFGIAICLQVSVLFSMVFIIIHSYYPHPTLSGEKEPIFHPCGCLRKFLTLLENKDYQCLVDGKRVTPYYMELINHLELVNKGCYIITKLLPASPAVWIIFIVAWYFSLLSSSISIKYKNNYTNGSSSSRDYSVQRKKGEMLRCQTSPWKI